MTIDILIKTAIIVFGLIVLAVFFTLLEYTDRKDKKPTDSPTAILIADEIIKVFEKYGYNVECISGQLKDSSKWQIRIKEKRCE